MLPVGDFCFRELMKNARVRRGFTVSLPGRDPEELEDTEILPGSFRGITRMKIIRWMRFFSRKRKEGFVKIAETDPYIEEGEERVNRLFRLLVEGGRYEDLARAANDREYQRELFEHYQL